jgi:hypothetical protein
MPVFAGTFKLPAVRVTVLALGELPAENTVASKLMLMEGAVLSAAWASASRRPHRRRFRPQVAAYSLQPCPHRRQLW